MQRKKTQTQNNDDTEKSSLEVFIRKKLSQTVSECANLPIQKKKGKYQEVPLKFLTKTIRRRKAKRKKRRENKRKE